MKSKRADTLFGAILRRFDKRAPIEEEYYRRLFSYLAENGSGDLAESPSYLKLARMAKSAYVYDDADKMEGFDAGALWAMVSMVEAKQANIKDALNSVQLRELVGKHNKLLAIIQQQPGITHGDLVEKSGIKKSNLSHIMAKLKQEGLVISRPQGTHRLYYLSTVGGELLRDLNEPDSELRRSTTSCAHRLMLRRF